MQRDAARAGRQIPPGHIEQRLGKRIAFVDGKLGLEICAAGNVAAHEGRCEPLFRDGKHASGPFGAVARGRQRGAFCPGPERTARHAAEHAVACRILPVSGAPRIDQRRHAVWEQLDPINSHLSVRFQNSSSPASEGEPGFAGRAGRLADGGAGGCLRGSSMISLDSGLRGIGIAPVLEGTGLTVSDGGRDPGALVGAAGLTAAGLGTGTGAGLAAACFLHFGHSPLSSRIPSHFSHRGTGTAAGRSE